MKKFKPSVIDVRQRDDLDTEEIKIIDEIEQYAKDIMSSLSK